MRFCLFVYMETIITMKGKILYLVGLNVKIFEAKLLRPRGKKTNKKTYPDKVPKCVVVGSIFGNPSFRSLGQINIKMHNNALHTRNVWMRNVWNIQYFNQ